MHIHYTHYYYYLLKGSFDLKYQILAFSTFHCAIQTLWSKTVDVTINRNDHTFFNSLIVHTTWLYKLVFDKNNSKIMTNLFQ